MKTGDEMTSADNLTYLGEMAEKAGVLEITNKVLYDPMFFHAPGSAEHHHNHRYGLLKHTAEVMRNVEEMTRGCPSPTLVTAVIWHDYMKTADYRIAEDESVYKTPYAKRINHLSGSAMAFHAEASRLKIGVGFMEEVEHLILSHHGRKDWGSPVEPDMAYAFILHAADMMSSRGCNLPWSRL